MTTKILIENLKIFAFHGVLPEEKILGTNYILNVEIQADLEKASESDELKDTINYAEINDILHNEMAIPSQLLEHVIGRIINKTKNKFPQISFIKVKLTKTNPPMKGEMDGVSVEIEKRF
ncbi:dihydroneopterin aldolase [Frigoriflavimonas asaccharolytica]|uniref:7,8-dihydroneopterin aldolase n=1 Tax=Frigoriflavimonas asaccharolytica TaxID=2735899 RepID=A0A8J8G7L4_9FLAO|nr:dihydroneopterin aldolase [Frigoriflavimonas asaccharolytica]NRS92968.1 dihydroneopterin aldolase [Frigoriflavimonas asaccharolytica]